MHLFPIFDLGGIKFDLSAILSIFITMAIIFVVARLSVRNLSVENPSKMQNFMEWVIEFVHSTIASTMPIEKAKKFISLGLTLILFIFVANMLGLPFVFVTDVHHPMEFFGITQAYLDSHGGAAHVAWWKSPTADIAVTAGLALVVFIIIHFLGMKWNRKHYIKHYFQPFWFFFPLNIIETIAKPVTLALRLYANIYAGEILISTILKLSIIGLPFMAVWQGFSMFVGGIQAFLFTVLTMVYISQAAIHDEEEHAH
jgi:F-type H+-transporting ATPase subunit a